MSTIAVFGASGRTGKPFITQALEAGHAVRALVRNPDKLGITHPNLTVLTGDALNRPQVEQTIAGADAVVSLLGRVKGSPPDLQTRATELIVAAMQRAGVQRLVSLTGGGVRDPNDRPKFMDNLIVFIMKKLPEARATLEDGARHAEVIRATALDWTVVRGPMLTEDAPKGSYRVGYVGVGTGIKLTRADLATFILEQLNRSEYVRKMPFLSN